MLTIGRMRLGMDKMYKIGMYPIQKRNGSKYQKESIDKLCITMRLVWEYSKGRGVCVSVCLFVCVSVCVCLIGHCY